ncbi:D-ribose ABC transporter substrate-binding protein [candidate division KSB3 bacterium]|uniref:D-ribose ABC transporter substrate-binding protein n=1 Tax=candidate division KSB3 bacterium TaxID=2044937 RepID=A0A2G6KBC1_9BACT|nr:MAG: D-ribose ABC transporter substrate-binding protein [candidate division KSB3 bacterium]
MKRLMIASILSLILVGLVTSTVFAADKFVLGFSPKALVSPFWIRMTEAVKEYGAANDIEVLIVAPPAETDVMQQMNMLEDLIQQGVDLIAVGPTDPQGLVPTLQGAIDAGIPVVIMETQTPLPGVDAVSVIGSDNVTAGRMVGEYTAKLLDGKGNVVVIEGIAGNNTGEERKQGFNEIMDQYDDLNVVASQPGNWERALAMNVMENILQSNPEVDFVFACSDEMGLGALMALEASDMQVPVIGVDGNKDAVIAIQEGRMEASVAQSPEKMGELLITEVVEKLRDGQDVEPILTTEFFMITKDNADQFLQD